MRWRIKIKYCLSFERSWLRRPTNIARRRGRFRASGPRRGVSWKNWSRRRSTILPCEPVFGSRWKRTRPKSTGLRRASTKWFTGSRPTLGRQCVLSNKLWAGANPAGKRKTAAAQRTLVFDEIDTGIGGRAAEAVGKKLKALSKANQVLCVTHLPQIATFADHHYVIAKKDSAGPRR